MGRYLNEAEHHAEEIRHYHRHAGADGYSQAELNWSQLNGLPRRAAKSRNDKGDLLAILEICKSSSRLVEEMRRRSTS